MGGDKIANFNKEFYFKFFLFFFLIDIWTGVIAYSQYTQTTYQDTGQPDIGDMETIGGVVGFIKSL